MPVPEGYGGYGLTKREIHNAPCNGESNSSGGGSGRTSLETGLRPSPPFIHCGQRSTSRAFLSLIVRTVLPVDFAFLA